MPLKLIYFAVAGRAEATRQILIQGGIPYEEVTVERSNWPDLKPKMPFGQVPVLELEDGRLLAQSGAIERYAAKLAGLYPSDPVTAAFADQAAFLVTETFDLVLPTFFLPDLDAKIKARQELLNGKLKDKLLALQKSVEHQPYLAGQELTFADFNAFCILGTLKSGNLDGIPKTILDDYPKLKEHFNRIANLPAIKAYYANTSSDRVTYQGA